MQFSKLAPVVLFCYNRLQHLQQTIESLKSNDLASRSNLIIFSDGPKSDEDNIAVQEIRAYLKSISGFAGIEIIESKINKGLANSVIDGVSRIIEKYSKVIVLEDDMICTPDFLTFMNEALTTYQSRPYIFSVTGYAPPINIPKNYSEDLYLAPRASSWGWGTWIDRWEKADWKVADFNTLKNSPSLIKEFTEGGGDLWPMLFKQQQGIIDSWAIRWTYCQFKNRAYGVYPVKSKIKNIGTDGSGTNFFFKTKYYDTELNENKIVIPFDLQPDKAVITSFNKYYKLSIPVKIKNIIKFRLF